MIGKMEIKVNKYPGDKNNEWNVDEYKNSRSGIYYSEEVEQYFFYNSDDKLLVGVDKKTFENCIIEHYDKAEIEDVCADPVKEYKPDIPSSFISDIIAVCLDPKEYLKNKNRD